jgi:hypothetical protein
VLALGLKSCRIAPRRRQFEPAQAGFGIIKALKNSRKSRALTFTRSFVQVRSLSQNQSFSQYFF